MSFRALVEKSPAEEETDEKPSPLGEGGTECRMRGRANGKATVNEYPKYSPAVAHRQFPKKQRFTAKINSVHVFTRNKSGRVNTQTVKTQKEVKKSGK